MDTSIFKKLLSREMLSKEGWKKLTSEERNFALLTLAGILLLLYYLIIWSPLQNKADSLQLQITQDKKLLASLVQANNKISVMKKTSQIAKVAAQTPLLTLLDQESKRNAWNKYLVNMKQVENQVEVSLSKINFDDFIKGLEEMNDKYNLQIEKVDLARLNNEGAVQATILFQ